MKMLSHGLAPWQKLSPRQQWQKDRAARQRYTLAAGRLILKDGRQLATLHGVGQYDPCEVDQLARDMVAALNRGNDGQP